MRRVVSCVGSYLERLRTTPKNVTERYSHLKGKQPFFIPTNCCTSKAQARKRLRVQRQACPAKHSAKKIFHCHFFHLKRDRRDGKGR